MTRSVPRRPLGLASRLLAAQTLVVLVGALTAWVVAGVIAPPLFLDHLARAGDTDSAAATEHAAEAFRTATAASLSVALLAALASATAVSVYVTRRIGRSVETVAAAAATIAGGRYGTRVPQPGLGAEFDVLADSFNRMTDRIESVEATRRRLLSDLGHEMRTPLATLDAYLEGIQDGVTRLDADTTAMLRTQTHRLVRLSEGIRAISAAEEHQLGLALQPLSADGLVQDAVAAEAARYAAKGVTLATDVAPGTPRVLGDPDRLGQVLANLLDNAVRHTPPGGSVTVTARPAAGGIELAVCDTGEGIGDQHLDNVFTRFYRVDSARDRDHGGSGIGLAISKAIVEAHGGHIHVASAGPGRGATFTLWLAPAPPSPTGSATALGRL